MNRAAYFILFWIFIGIPTVEAQQKHQIEISLTGGFAQGAFGDNLDRPMPGLIFSFGGHTPNFPLVLSTEIGWLNSGFGDYLEFRFPSDTAPISLVNVQSKSSIILTHLVTSIVPLEGKISPYIDGLIGFKYLSTHLTIESEALFDNDDSIVVNGDEEIFTSSTFASFALSYGIGAGVNIQVFKGELGWHKPESSIFIHLGAQYLLGSEADYVAENSIRVQESGITFEQIESDTNLLIPKLGMKVGF